MYSRTPAPPPRRPPTPVGRPSYVRQRNVRPDFRVPPNYSGNTFRPRPSEGEAMPYLSEQERDRPAVPNDRAFLPPPEVLPHEDAPIHPEARPRKDASDPPQGILTLANFPFGHGIGAEELLSRATISVIE